MEGDQRPPTTNDPLTERWLSDYGVNFTLAQIPLDTIRSDDPLSQVRDEEFDEEWVASRVQTLTAEGAVYPPVVVNRTGYGSYTVIDGRNRRELHRRAEREWMDAYILEVDTTTAETIAAEANQVLNGRNLSESELRALVRRRRDAGVDSKQIMAQLHLTQTRYASLVRLDKAITRAVRLRSPLLSMWQGRTGYRSISTSLFTAIGSGIRRDEDYKALVQVIVSKHPTTAAITTAVKTISAATSDDEVTEALRVLGQPRQFAHKNKANEMKMFLGRFNSLIPKLPDRLRTGNERIEAAIALEAMRKTIDQVLEELEAEV